MMRRLALPALALICAAQAPAANLVTNGNFEGGNTDFSSDYNYNAGSGLPAGVYTVGTSPKAWNANFVAIGDHTSGSGNMMMINGADDTSKNVWQSGLISVQAGQDYFFEAFVASLYSSSPPILTFLYSLDNGPALSLGTLSNSLDTGVWEGFSTSFNTGAATTVQLFLRNAQSASTGNDFALDDVYLGTASIVNPPAVPEPATWAMTILGFGAVGGALRRRKAKPSLSFA